MLSSLQWQRFGYPISMPVDEFWDRYYLLGNKRPKAPKGASAAYIAEFCLPNDSVREGVIEILNNAPFEKHHWRIGTYSVFLRPRPLHDLEELRHRIEWSAASAISSRVKRQRIEKFFTMRREAITKMQPVIRGILTRQLYTRALEMAFMTFSDQESTKYNEAVHQEECEMQESLAKMAAEEAASKADWQKVDGDKTMENMNLCAMYNNYMQAGALNAIWSLDRKTNAAFDGEDQNENSAMYFDPEATPHPVSVAEGQGVYSLDDIEHDNPYTEHSDIAMMAVNMMEMLSGDVINAAIDKAAAEKELLHKEEDKMQQTMAKMAAEESHLKNYYKEIANRKKMTPGQEMNQMIQAEYQMKCSQYLKDSEKFMKKMDAKAKPALEMAQELIPEDVSNVEKGGSSLFDLLKSSADLGLAQALAATADPGILDPSKALQDHIQSADKELQKDTSQSFIEGIIDRICVDAETKGEKKRNDRKWVAIKDKRRKEIDQLQMAREMSRREMENQQAEEEQQRAEDRRARKEAEEVEKRKVAEALADKLRLEQLEKDKNKEPEVPPSKSAVVNALRAERDSSKWSEMEKRARSERPLLTRSQQTIEKELFQLQAMINASEELDEDDTVKFLSAASDLDTNLGHKYMYKYKFKALVVDDDSEMMEDP